MKPLSLLALTMLAPALALASSIQGMVKTWTPNGHRATVNQEVMLRIFNSKTQIAAARTITNEKGQYQFDIDPSQDWFYRIRVPYAQTHFDSDFFKAPLTRVDDIIVAETTGSIDALKIAEVVFFEFGSGELVKISHQLEIVNTGNKAYHPQSKDAAFAFIELIEGGFNLSIIGGLTRRDLRIDEDSHTLFIETQILPGETKSLRFSYMYPRSQSSIEFNRSTTSMHKSLHLISNRAQSKINKSVARQIDIPTSLGTNFKKAYDVDLTAPSLHFYIRGIPRNKDRMRNWTLWLSLLLGLSLIALIWRTPLPQQEQSPQELQDKINALKNLPNQTPEIASKIDLLQRKLYHILYP